MKPEITEKMEEAGLLILLGFDPQCGDPRETAKQVYKAMEEARHSCSSSSQSEGLSHLSDRQF